MNLSYDDLILVSQSIISNIMSCNELKKKYGNNESFDDYNNELVVLLNRVETKIKQLDGNPNNENI